VGCNRPTIVIIKATSSNLISDIYSKKHRQKPKEKLNSVQMIKSIFYFEKLSTSDKITLGLYVPLTIYIFYISELSQEIIFYYCLMTPLGLYVFLL